MPETFGMSIRGERALVRALERLPGRVQKQVARKTLRPAASMVSKAIKRGVPELTKEDAVALLGPTAANRPGATVDGRDLTRFVKKSVKRKPRTYRNTGTIIEAVGPRYDERAPGVPVSGGYLAEMIERGDGVDRPARPFVRTAYRQTATAALGAMLGRSRELVLEEAKKARAASGGR